MTEEQREHVLRERNGWKWATIIVGALLVAGLICLISAFWGGVVGYIVGRRSAQPVPMMPWHFEPQPFDERSLPELPQQVPGIGDRAWLGVTFYSTTEGAEITSVVSGSPADEAGLVEGDIITHVDGRLVNEERPLDQIIQSYSADDRVELTVLRNGRQRTMNVRLGSIAERGE